MVDGYTTMNCLAKFCLNVLRSSLFLEPVFVGHMLPSNTYASSQVNIMSHAKIGIIFNSDPHTKSGSHWIALFIDLQKKFIFYFDSNGDKIPKRIDILVKRIIEQAGQLNMNLAFYSNEGKEHQKKDGQCGMYTLFFIIELLKGTKEANFFKNTRIPDEMMRDYRSIYYN